MKKIANVSCVLVIALIAAIWISPANSQLRISEEQAAVLLKTARASSEKGDFQSALKIWHQLAAQGNAKAQNNIGWANWTGSGVPKNEREATAWYRKAADSGLASAQQSLGSAYYFGTGVPQDKTKAAQLFRLAAVQGDEIAQLNLGLSYMKGHGVPADAKEGRSWLSKAAAQGNTDAASAIREFDTNLAKLSKETVIGTYHYANTMDDGLYFVVEPNEKSLKAFPELRGHTSFNVANVAEMSKLMDLPAPESDPGTPYWCLSYSGEVGLQVGKFERRTVETEDGNEDRIYATAKAVLAKTVTSKECRGTPPKKSVASLPASSRKASTSSQVLEENVTCFVSDRGQPICTLDIDAQKLSLQIGREVQPIAIGFIDDLSSAVKLGMTGEILAKAKRNKCSYVARMGVEVGKAKVESDMDGDIISFPLVKLVNSTGLKLAPSNKQREECQKG